MENILKLPKDKVIRLVTHSGTFHPDELFATAVLDFVLTKAGYKYEVIRTRDFNVFGTADIIYDVGLVFDPENNKFDHHQPEMTEERDSVPYSSLGLIWKYFGMYACDNDLEHFKYIENKFIKLIDLDDNGIKSYSPVFDKLKPVTMESIVSDFNLNPRELSDISDEKFAFDSALSFAKNYFKRVFVISKYKVDDSKEVARIYNSSEDKRFLVFDKYLEFKDEIAKYKEVMFVVYPEDAATGRRWHVRSAVNNSDKFNIRCYFKEEWGGLNDKELSSVTGISDSIFCHKDRFLCVVGSKESAIKIAEMSVNNNI